MRYRRARAALTWGVVGAVAAIGGAAAVDALRAPSPPRTDEVEDGRPAELQGARVPAPGRLPGRLFFLPLGGCRVRALDFSTGSAQNPGPAALCRLWASPAGKLAVLPVERGFRAGAVTYRTVLVEFRDGSAVERPLATVRGDVAWSRDGKRVAWCTATGTTVVLTLPRALRTHLPGCRPKIAPQGFVLTRPDRPLAGTLLANGRPLLRTRDLRRAFSAPAGSLVDLLGYDVREDGLLAVAAVLFEAGRIPRPAVQLWRGGRLEALIPLPPLGSPAGRGRFGERVEFSPDGDELVVSFPAPGFRMVLVDVRTRRIVLPPTSQHGFDWSRDGRWFALSTGEEILVYASPGADPLYVLPIGASAIAWRS